MSVCADLAPRTYLRRLMPVATLTVAKKVELNAELPLASAPQWVTPALWLTDRRRRHSTWYNALQHTPSPNYRWRRLRLGQRLSPAPAFARLSSDGSRRARRC